MSATRTPLSPSAYAVLGAIAQGPTHGFAIARRLQPTGDLGQVWSLTRPLVYRELARLIERDLVLEAAGEAGDRGPRRTVVRATAAGEAENDRWLAEPVDRVRDFRSMFLLKLALLDGSGADARPLARAQRDRFSRRLAEMGQEYERGEGFDRRVIQWRMLSTRAAMEFLDTVISAGSR